MMGIVEEHIKREQYIEEVAAYIRVSTQEQKLHGISLAAQVEKLTEYAENHGMKIVEWYKDEGVSGRKLIKKRPELQRMIQDAEKRKFKRIIFIKLDRFFRSVAEYHECMKRLATGGVIWTATEEKYDLSTPSGEAFVNMKLTMAQFEADQAGERIRMVNEYKVKTGQPLFGAQSFPFCFTVEQPKDGERHKYVAKENAEIMHDLINHFKKHHSVRAAMHHVNQLHGCALTYATVMNALTNEMICGSYKGNPNYCPAYVTREEFDMIQKSIKRNPRTDPSEHTYLYTGLIRCPECGRRLSAGIVTAPKYDKHGNKIKSYKYHGYRCQKGNLEKTCAFRTVAFEARLERELLDSIEDIVREKKLKVVKMQSEAQRTSQHDVTALQQELDRLNYSWQKGRIKTVEEYDKRYDELMEKIEEANAEQSSLYDEPDYEKIEQILSGDWKEIYNALDAMHKRSFWRSFIDEINIEWTKDVKRVADISFL